MDSTRTPDRDATGIVRRGDPAAGAAPPEVVVEHRRSPVDLLHALAAAMVLLTALLASLLAGDVVADAEADVVAFVDRLAPAWSRLLSGLLQLVVAASLLAVVVGPVLRRRWRTAGGVLVAGAGAAAVMAVLDATGAVGSVAGDAPRGVVEGGHPSTPTLAALVAALVVVAPTLSMRWRREATGTAVSVVVLRLLVAAEPPADVLAVPAVGVMCGAAALLALGRPVPRPTPVALLGVLALHGLRVTDLAPASVDARGSVPYLGRRTGGGGVFAKVLGRDERSADLLFRLYRWVRLRDVGDERPFSSLRRAVEHEAFVALLARDAGVRTPRLLAVARVEPDWWMLVSDRVDGASLDAVERTRVDDGVLADLWQQVRLLRERRIAHRDLRLANVFLDDGGAVWMIDFGFSEASADDALLDADLAQLLASLSLVVGADRAVRSAVDHLGPAAVLSCLPRLQRQALSSATRAQMPSASLEELRRAAADRCGSTPPPLEPLGRVRAGPAVAVASLAVVTYLVVPQLAEVGVALGRIDSTDLWALVALALLTVASLAGSSVALTGATPVRLRPGATFAVQLGAAYTTKLAPAWLGATALNLRYLQKRGLDAAAAAAAVGLRAAARIWVHLVALGLMVLWAGRTELGTATLPRAEVLVEVVVLVASGAVVALVAPLRRRVVDRLAPVLHSARRGAAVLAASPGRALVLVGGNVVAVASLVAAMWCAAVAVDLGPGVLEVAAVYLSATAVAALVPTPGGLGAVEAALVGGFVAAGADPAAAVAGVFLFRAATFWLPVPAGVAAVAWLRREDHL